MASVNERRGFCEEPLEPPDPSELAENEDGEEVEPDTEELEQVGGA